LLVLVIGMLSLLPVSGLAASADVPAQARADRWLVQLKWDAVPGPVDSGLEQRIGDAALRPLAAGPGAYLVSFDGSTLASDGVALLMSDQWVAYVEPNIILHYQYVPNDPHVPDQSWAKTVQLPDAWSIATGRASTVVAVLDSGVRSDHPDLAGKLVSGHDFIGNDDDPQDEVGHGTAVAGIIAAAGNNGVGIAGAAMDVAIMPVRVGDASRAPLGTLVEGIYYAVDHGAAVINLSLGTDVESAKLKDAVDYAYNHNVEVVAAAGNQSGGVAYPANYGHAISVAATNAEGRGLASFSSRISRVDASAPGVGVYTTAWNATSGNGWQAESGTSFATPTVAGVLALMRSVNPSLTVEDVRHALTGTAHWRTVGLAGRRTGRCTGGASEGAGAEFCRSLAALG
jgi:thermitase